MTKLTDTFDIYNGVKIPKVAFGTWQIPASDAKQAVHDAIDIGYRHIDTALAYANEKEVGEAVRDSGVKREDLFVTSKLPGQTKNYDDTLRDFDTTMKNLDIDYLDLYLVHAPWPWSEIGSNYDKQNQDVWRAMEKIYNSGRVKAIGVSNFNVHDLENVLKTATIKPMVDQIQYYIGYTEPKITKFAQDHDILVEAYSPLATGGLVNNQDILKIAQKYNVSVPQLAIQFVVQNGVLPLPKAVHKAHIEDNAKLDFEISAEDMKTLNVMPDTAPTHSHNSTQG
ncbi:aldo/keto reductase [Companilactobacillus alimentarius]|uniref:2,5-diketo-D-gluconic acid reductase n=1 Tax=Companilactobacillus alimentarius DSM 20249 TaxID=1423720 RepID=A0A2K9HIK5_9LACO|nr:aldo/keto reductase [Companilactobacillus alimentarius]AUI72384.1 2,5-diketo-D-gluconic acid reductase [Companilactobacillus alimentarius DSM 20249]KRK75876.1 oxidoreductase [Companilactobacillus alimentarius DSM 20249]GEO45802.1 2,5-diketo-D-gluconic acid reductase [Companilactobacillus alimentarius]